MSIICKVEGCRYNTKHLTQDHVCGTCDGVGHGQRECNSSIKRLMLLKTIDDDTPHKLHMIPTKEIYEGKSIYAPLAMIVNAKGFRELKAGEYTFAGAGMGCCTYGKHNGRFIEYLFLYDTDSQSIKTSPEIQQFVKGYTKHIPSPVHYKPRPFSGLLD